ncbi:MAG: LPS export ABC transporter periplasmic protein LptC [candidate division WOR-3 bacterium]
MNKIFLIFALLSFWSCRNPEETENIKKEESLSSFVLKNYKGSKLSWRLIAKKAKISDTISIYGLEVEFFEINSGISSILKADSGFIFNNNKDLKVMGNVVITSSDSMKLWTDELNWSEDRQKIFTDSEIKYSKGKETYKGKGLEADPDLKKIIIKEKFTGEGEFK